MARELVELADILPLPPADPGPAASGWTGLVVLALVLTLVLTRAGAALLRRRRGSLARLRRQLRRGRIAPRAAAHALARHGAGGALRRRLDGLRFGRRPPAAGEVLELLEALRRGH